MKKAIEKWSNSSLVLRILCGLIIGAILGLACPNATAIAILGKVFVGALKAVAPVLVFVLVMSAISKAGAGIGSRFRTVIILYMLSTLLAAVVAVVGSFVFPVDMVLTASYGDEFLTLSVCAYHVDNGRLVVVGKRIK